MLKEVVKVAVHKVQLLQDGDDPLAFGALGLLNGFDHDVSGDRVVHAVEVKGIDAVLEIFFFEEGSERHQVREDDPHKIRPRKNAALSDVPVWSLVSITSFLYVFFWM